MTRVLTSEKSHTVKEGSCSAGVGTTSMLGLRDLPRMLRGDSVSESKSKISILGVWAARLTMGGDWPALETTRS